MTQHITIAIDGPSSSGKSTVASMIAKKLGILHLNTGSMYRAVAYYFISSGLDYNDENVVNQHLPNIHIDVKHENGQQQDYLNNQLVTPFLRTNEVSVGASIVSQYGKVREMAVSIQRKVASQMSVIMEGRDIGTVVLPNATNKFFLTASAEERTNRRYKENLEKGIATDYNQLLIEVKERDLRDTTRAHSPLKQAPDAVFVDSTNMTIEQVVQTMMEHINK
jgi:cytidylate kinase